MDDIIEIAIELVGGLLEAAVKRTKDPKKRKWAIRIFGGFWLVALATVMTWWMVDLYREGNVIGAVVFAAITVLVVIFLRVFITHRRKKK